MSMIGGKTGDRPGGTAGSNHSGGLLEAYEEFRNYVRKVAQDTEVKISVDDPDATSSAAEMKVDVEDYVDAYIACAKVKRILNHNFIGELIKAGKTWQAEFGNDESTIVDSDPSVGLEAFFISTGEKLLVRKRGKFGIVYYFGWYETKPLIMRNINLIEFGKTSEGYQVVNADFNQVRESIIEYMDIQ
jgi:hypothetical protein